MLGDSQREARLAAAARTGQGDEPMLARSSARTSRTSVSRPTKLVSWRRQVVARPLDRPKRTGDVVQAGGTHIEHLLGPAEVLQAMLTQVAEPRRPAGRARREPSRAEADTSTWPPWPIANSRATRLTVGPKKSSSRRVHSPVWIAIRARIVDG